MTKRIKSAEIKFYLEPELRSQVEQDRGLVSLSAWMRDAIRLKLSSNTTIDRKEA